jgi:hypothetical protein
MDGFSVAQPEFFHLTFINFPIPKRKIPQFFISNGKNLNLNFLPYSSYGRRWNSLIIIIIIIIIEKQPKLTKKKWIIRYQPKLT